MDCMQFFSIYTKIMPAAIVVTGDDQTLHVLKPSGPNFSQCNANADNIFTAAKIIECKTQSVSNST